MSSPPEQRIAGLVLAAGASRLTGRPKQLLPYGDGVLLDAVLATAQALAGLKLAHWGQAQLGQAQLGQAQ